jgi:hypothetical protein
MDTFNPAYFEFYEKLEALVEARIAKRLKDIPERPYKSPEIKDLIAALNKAQAEYKRVTPNRTTQYFKLEYTDYDTMMDMARPLLAKNGIAVLQWTELDNGAVILHTSIYHESGQWMESRERLIPSKNDPKTIESALNHLKRIQAMSLLNITLHNDPLDDDADIEMIDKRNELTQGTSVVLNQKIKSQSTETITKEQIEELEYELGEHIDLAEMMLDAYKIRSLADLPKADFIKAVTKIRKLKELRANMVPSNK